MTSFCCPICGSLISDDDRKCNACDAPLEEIEYALGKILRERRDPGATTDFSAMEHTPCFQVICPECGARAGNHFHECHACGFPLRKRIKEGYAPILRACAGYAERRAVAIDPRASESTLDALSNDALPFVRRGVATNPSAPEGFLISQSTSEDVAMRRAVAGNLSTPAHILEDLAGDEDDSTKRQVALNDSAPEGVRLKAVSLMHWTSLVELAKDDSPAWLLDTLADNESKLVRAQVGANAACASSTFEQLSRDPEESVRIAVAKNLSTPRETLTHMAAHDSSHNVRYELAMNPRVPIGVRESLSTQRDVAFVARQAITRRMEPPSVEPEKIHEHIFSKRQEDRSIASSRLTPEKIIRGFVEQGDGPLESCLSNPSTPPDLIREIVKRIEGTYKRGGNDPCQYTIARIVERDDLDDMTMHLLATSHYDWVLRAVADDPRISYEDLDALSHNTYSRVRASAARNPKATVTMLERLAFDKDEEVRLSVLWNPRTPSELAEIISTRRSKTLSDVLKARNPDIRPEELERFCSGYSSKYESDPHTLARTEAAQNPAASAILLDTLARDSYREVRQAVVRNVNAPDRVIAVAKSNETPTPLKGNERIPKKWETYSERDDLQWIWGQFVTSDDHKSDIDYDFLYRVRKVKQMSYLAWLAEHESTPIFIYERIASDTDIYAREKLAANRCVPTHLQRQLAFDKSAEVRRKLAENSFSSPDVLDILSYDIDNRTRKKAQLRLKKLQM